MLVATIIGVAIAGYMMWVALEHNPQGEYCAYIDSNNCKLQWLSLFRVGLFSFAPTFLVITVLGFVLTKVIGFFYSQK